MFQKWPQIDTKIALKCSQHISKMIRNYLENDAEITLEWNMSLMKPKMTQKRFKDDPKMLNWF